MEQEDPLEEDATDVQDPSARPHGQPEVGPPSRQQVQGAAGPEEPPLAAAAPACTSQEEPPVEPHARPTDTQKQEHSHRDAGRIGRDGRKSAESEIRPLCPLGNDVRLEPRRTVPRHHEIDHCKGTDIHQATFELESIPPGLRQDDLVCVRPDEYKESAPMLAQARGELARAPAKVPADLGQARVETTCQPVGEGTIPDTSSSTRSWADVARQSALIASQAIPPNAKLRSARAAGLAQSRRLLMECA